VEAAVENGLAQPALSANQNAAFHDATLTETVVHATLDEDAVAAGFRVWGFEFRVSGLG